MIKPNQIIHGDCLKVMKKFADKSVDLILTDPPYNAKNIGPQLKLIEILIDKFSNEGDLVLDIMAGICTTAVACKNLKRKFIMIEKTEKYCEIGYEKLRQEILL